MIQIMQIIQSVNGMAELPTHHLFYITLVQQEAKVTFIFIERKVVRGLGSMLLHCLLDKKLT